MEAACKKCWSAACFCKLLATLSRGTNRGLTPARTCQDRRKLFVPAVAGREMLGVPYINRPRCCHSDMVFCLGFAPLAFGSDKNLYHKAVVYNFAWQGRQTPWVVAVPGVLQHLHTSDPPQCCYYICILANIWYLIKLIHSIIIILRVFMFYKQRVLAKLLWSKRQRDLCQSQAQRCMLLRCAYEMSDKQFV